MTAYTLKEKHLQYNPHSHFFDHDTMKFFGECLSNMYVYKDTIKMKDISGEEHDCIVVSSLQKKHPSGPKKVLHYFDAYTYEHVIP